MKKRLKMLIKILVPILIILMIFIHFSFIHFKMKIEKTTKVEIYMYDANNYQLQKSIEDSSTIKELIHIFKSLSYSSKIKMLPKPQYKIIFYNKQGKKITEINCIPGIIIPELSEPVELPREEYQSLNHLITSNLETN